VYLFDAKQVLNELGARGAKIGTASSVRNTEWDAAEIYPRPNNPLITVKPDQAALLRLFALQTMTGAESPEPRSIGANDPEIGSRDSGAAP
jgi:hypothetical protein